jgi:hypothetical protein
MKPYPFAAGRWRMCPYTISPPVLQRVQRFRLKLIKLNELTHPGWEDAADNFRATDQKYRTFESSIPAVIELWTDGIAAAPAPATYRDLLVCLDIVHRILQMLQGTSRPGSSHIRPGAVMQQSQTRIASLAPTVEPDSSPLLTVMIVQPVSKYLCRLPSKLVTVEYMNSDEDRVTSSSSAEQYTRNVYF